MNEPVDISSPLWKRVKRTAIEYLAVFIAAAAFLLSGALTILAVGVSGVAVWIAYDANENAKIVRMEMADHIKKEHRNDR